MKAVSTFSGCGGGSLGLSRAGFKILWANEFIPDAADTYESNFPLTPLSRKDIRSTTSREILDACNLKIGELDLLEGSPPCASFSMAGKREAGWGLERKYSDTKQRVDDLFFEFIRLAEGIMPKAILAENVVGLTAGKASGILKEIGKGIADLGYVVRARVLNSSSFGVPQRRPRLFIQAIRSDLNIVPSWPRPKGTLVSIRDSLPWVRPGVDYDDHPDAPTKEERDACSFERFAIYPVWKKLSIGRSPKGSYFSLIRSNPLAPSPTILVTAGNLGAAGVAHPYEPRKWTIPELKTLCGFPQDFVLTGPYEKQWERLGRAVSPPVYEAIGRCIRDSLSAP